MHAQSLKVTASMFLGAVLAWVAIFGVSFGFTWMALLSAPAALETVRNVAVITGCAYLVSLLYLFAAAPIPVLPFVESIWRGILAPILAIVEIILNLFNPQGNLSG